MKNYPTLLILLLIFGCQSQDAPDSFDPQDAEVKKILENPEPLPIDSEHAIAVSELIEKYDCTEKPTLADVQTGQWTYKDRLYKAKQAHKLGIPIASGKITNDLMVYVRDYSRISQCEAENGTTINFGQVIRTIIEIHDYSGDMGVDFASIAAKGTLSSKSQNIYIYKDGFFNPNFDQIISEVSGKTFNVENYSIYNEVMAKLISLLSEEETTFSVNKIGVELKITDDEFLIEAPIVSFILTQIAKGKNCAKIKTDNFSKDLKSQELVDKTFQALELNCNQSEISKIEKEKAKIYLQGYRVKK